MTEPLFTQWICATDLRCLCGPKDADGHECHCWRTSERRRYCAGCGARLDHIVFDTGERVR